MSDKRARLSRQLQRAGASRRKNLEAVDESLAQIAELLPAALEAGFTKTEIERLTGVSRPTIDALLRERR
jgi:hypothetical protein